MRPNERDPRRTRTGAAEIITEGPGRRQQGTAGVRHGHGADDLETWVRYSCARRGCSCEPTVTVVTEGRLTRASVAHDQDCPAIAEVA